MYTVVIADDFELDRKQIVSAIQSFAKLSLQIIGECENGIEAFDLVCNLKPDILICDVEMPGLTGLELADRLREIDANLRIIFCSLYDKLHYLQAAIQVHSDGYIMKPFIPSELENCLGKVLLQLVDMKQQQEELITLKQAMTNNHISLMREFFSDLIFDRTLSQTEIVRRREQLQIALSTSFRLAMIDINEQPDLLATQPMWEDAAVIPYRVYEALKRGVDWEIPHYIVRINEKRYVVIFCYQQTDEKTETRHATEKLLSDFVQKMKTCAISVTVTFSKQIAQLSKLREQYKLCKYRLNNKRQYGGDAVIFADEETLHDANLDLNTAEILEHVRMMISNGDIDFEKNVQRYTHELFALQQPNQLQMLCHYIVAIVQLTLQENNIAPDCAEADYNTVSQRMLALGDDMACCSFVNNLLVKAHECFHQSNNVDRENFVRSVKAYIRDSDLKNIQLCNVADRFSYSPNYLNHLFKEETGITILDYITQCRMNKAKEMMMHSNKRLGDIATEIGYSHATYFSIVFKKTEGVTPKVFMERHK